MPIRFPNCLTGKLAQFSALVLMLSISPQAYANPPSTQFALKYQLQCKTVDAPLPKDNKASTQTCDDVCETAGATCVSTGDITNPRNCETPTGSTCRCCSVVEGR